MATEKGFTLLEILVAISIASLLLIAIYGVFGPLSEARDQIEARGAVYHQARGLYDRLGKELRSLSGTASSLSGGKDPRGQTYLELNSLAGTPMGGIPGGAVAIRYLWAEDRTPGSTEKALFRSERISWADDDGQPGQRMIADIANFEIGFFDGTQWQTDWSATATRRPEALRISLILVDGEEQGPFRTEFDLP
jgi:general secretion pathway protein J